MNFDDSVVLHRVMGGFSVHISKVHRWATMAENAPAPSSKWVSDFNKVVSRTNKLFDSIQGCLTIKKMGV